MKKPLAALLLATALPLTAQTANVPVNPKTAEAVHDSAIVIDTHADTTQRLVDENYDLTDPLNGGQLNFDSAKKGNLGAEFFSIWVEPELYKGHDARRTLELIDAVYRQAAKHPDRMMMAFTAADIEKAHREHKLAALMGIEGGHSIENSLGLLRDYYRLGVRYMTLTWSNSLDWANSSGDEGKPGVPHNPDGLTPFGKEVVQEMNRLGMMVDISHVADDTFWAAIKTSKAPLIASHSAARAISNAPRNMTDDMLRAVAKNGGVVQVNYYSAFVSQAYRDASIAQEPIVKKATDDLKAQFRAEGKQLTYGELEKLQRSYADRIPRPPLSALIDNIDHIAKIAGVDHVGLGSDFDGVSGQLPAGIDSAADLPKITAALLERGYSAEDCHKILGGNLLRVMREVERVSHEMQAEKN
jgi:membrane dipeptidase